MIKPQICEEPLNGFSPPLDVILEDAARRCRLLRFFCSAPSGPLGICPSHLPASAEYSLVLVLDWRLGGGLEGSLPPSSLELERILVQACGGM